MATLGQNELTLADMAKRLNPDGMMAKVANLLSQSNPAVADIPWVASNDKMSHRSSILIGEPTANLRRLNEGVSSGKSVVSQINDTMSLLETQSTTDVKLLQLYGNVAQARQGEARIHVQSLGKKVEDLLWHGSEASDDREFNGFQVRYPALATGNVLTGLGDGVNLQSSVYLVGWGMDSVFGIYPQNTTAGLQHTDMGEQLIQTADDSGVGATAKMRAFVDVFTWDCGLVVKDWRNVVRIANVESGDLKGVKEDQQLADYPSALPYLMAEAIHLLPNIDAVRPVFYMPREVFIGLDRWAMAATMANIFQTKDVDGRPVTTFRGIPIKISDKLTHTEAVVA